MANNLDPRRRRGWQTMAKSFAGTRRRRVGQMMAKSLAGTHRRWVDVQ